MKNTAHPNTVYANDGTIHYTTEDMLVLQEALENSEVSAFVLSVIMERLDIGLSVRWDGDEPIEFDAK